MTTQGRAAHRSASPIPADPQSLVASAETFASQGNVLALIDALDNLAGMVGPEPIVFEALSRHRPQIDAALGDRSSDIEAKTRFMLSARARRLWAFLPDLVSEPSMFPEDAAPQGLGVDALIDIADKRAERKDCSGLLDILEELAGFAGPQPAVIDVLIRHKQMIDATLSGSDNAFDATDRAVLTVRARRLWAFLPDSAGQALSEPTPARSRQSGPSLADTATRLSIDDYGIWLDAARLAAKAEDHATVSSCCREALKAVPNDRRARSEVAAFLTECGVHAEAISIWRSAYAEEPHNISLALRLFRAIETSRQTDMLFDEVGSVLAKAPPFGSLDAANQNAVVEIFRRLEGHLGVKDLPAKLDALEQVLIRHQQPGALLYWALGVLDSWRFDRSAAFEHFDMALTQTDLAPDVTFDLHAEKALLFARYHFYGEALIEMAAIPERIMRSNVHYQRRLDSVRTVGELCADAPAPLRYPECLIDVIWDELAQAPLGYDPRPGHVAMISGSLGQGGGERQTITVVKQVNTDRRVEKLTLLVRSTHLRPTDDFFLPLVSELALDYHIYGMHWFTPSNVMVMLPELENRPRLAKAIDLLPQTIREDVVRLCRHLFDVRPQAVHIWQDITGAALACKIAGVPHFFVHRGSLSPDYWGQTERQTETHFRPMRHTYRRLLERPDFVILNNSSAGCRTDQNWTNWSDSAPFQVLANAIDFHLLGENIGRNVELRRSLGIPDDALVVGGSFRIFSVKRPQYWIAAARSISQAVPNAHFLIIGDGDMTELVQERAREYGIADRLHLPGRVSNVGDWYRTMDVSLLTSEREGIPNAIIEAQHFGVPIVATDVGGIRESIAENDSGYVVPGNSPEEYAERVIAILRDPIWREKAANRAPDFVHEKFSLERVVDRLIRYYGIDTASEP